MCCVFIAVAAYRRYYFGIPDSIKLYSLQINGIKQFNTKQQQQQFNLSTTMSHPFDDLGHELQELHDFCSAYSSCHCFLLNEMLCDIIVLLGSSPCSFSVIGSGSISRNELFPQSDLDLSFLISSQIGRATGQTYFQVMIEILEFKLKSKQSSKFKALQQIQCVGDRVDLLFVLA